MSAGIPIAEQLYVGLFNSDCACQTERSELVQLKNTNHLLQILYYEIERLKTELTFTGDSLRSAFQGELQTHGQTIYYQLTDKLDVLRKNQSKAIETLRLSYRSQLHDFISQARNIINSDKPLTIDQKPPPSNDGQDKLSFFHQSVLKGYETEIANLKKEIEQINESTKYEIALATSFLTDEKERLSKELSTINRSVAQAEDALTKKDEQIRDLKRDVSSLQAKLKDAKKVTVREPTPTAEPVQTQSRLAQTDPWAPTPANSDEATRQLEAMMQTRIEELEKKYQTVIEQKNIQIQQLMHEGEVQQKTFRTKMEKYLTIEERLHADMKRYAEKHKQEIQAWEAKYEILKKSMATLREEMYTRQTNIRDRFMAKPAVVTYN